MKTIAITFKGECEVRRQDIVITDEENNKVDATQLSAEEIVAGLKNGTYKLDFQATWMVSFDGNESFVYEVAED